MNRMNRDTMAMTVAIMMNNALVLDTIMNRDMGEYNGADWYDKAYNNIVAAANEFNVNIAIMARIIAHLSIATFWDKQESTLRAIAYAIAQYNGDNKLDVAKMCEVGTLYKGTAVDAMVYIDAVTAILDTAKKTHQFYAAIMTREDMYYVSDSHDLQYKGLVTPNNRGNALVKHKHAIDKIMRSENAYRMQLDYERALNDGHTPISRQARRWVWKSDNFDVLAANRHPDVYWRVIPCPVHEWPMVEWILR